MLSLDWCWAMALLCSWLCSRASQWWSSHCWVPRGLVRGIGHLLGPGIGPPFLWMMLYFLALEYLGVCHVLPDQISVQDELLWLLPVPDGADGITPLGRGCGAP